MSDLPDSLEKSQPASYRALRPDLPVAGFWSRGLAFAADAALLGSIFRVIIFFGREALFPLGAFNSVLFAAVALAYFTICDGPGLKGRTVGKMLAGIRVGDENGEVLSWRAALLRSLVKLQVIILQPPLLMIKYHADRTVDLPLYTFAAVYIYGIALVIVTIAFAVHMGLSPAKQAPYDLLVRSLVFKLKESAALEEIVALYQSPETFKKLKRTAVTWCLMITIGLAAIICWQFLKGYAATIRKDMDGRKELFTEFELPPHGYPLSIYFVPTRDESNGSGENDASSADAATTTTGTSISPGKYRIVYRCASGVTRESLQDDRERFAGHLRRFREWYIEKLKQEIENPANQSDKAWIERFNAALVQLRHIPFELALIRQIPLIILPYSENVYLIEIPALDEESKD